MGAREDRFETAVERPSEQFVGWFPSRLEFERDELLAAIAGDRSNVTTRAIAFAHKGVTEDPDEPGRYQIEGAVNLGKVEATLTAAQARTLVALFRPAVKAAAQAQLGGA